MKKIILIVIFGIIAGVLRAQIDKDVWLVDGQKHLGAHFKKYKFGFSFDARNTFLGNTKAKLGGIKFGLYINRIHQVGIGIYGMNKPVAVTQLPNTSFTFYSGKVEFGYASLFYERVLFFDPHWEWSAAVHFGSGEIKASYKLLEESTETKLPTIVVKPLELSTSVYRHLNYWLSIGGGLGHRFMRKTPEEYRPYFNGSIYLVKLKIRLFKLIKSTYNKDVKNEY